MNIDQIIEAIKALAWPAVITGVLVWLRKDIPRLLTILVQRIERGDTFKAAGIELTATQPRLPGPAVEDAEANSTKLVRDPGPPHSAFLIHKFRRDSSLDKNGYEYFRLKVWVETDGISPEQIESVTYHLHPTFQNPTKTISDRANNFLLSLPAWGAFLLFADINFKDGRVWRIERFLNF